MNFRAIYILAYPNLTRLLALIEVLVLTYKQILIRSSVSTLKDGRAALYFELQMDSNTSRQTLGLNIQNSIEMYGLKMTNVYLLFNEEPAFVKKLQGKYFGDQKTSFNIQSVNDLDKVFEEISINVKLTNH